MKRLSTILAIVFFVLSISGSFAKSLPPKVQALLLIKLLPYDRNIEQKITENTINIGILYNPVETSSLNEMKKIRSILEKLKPRVKIKGATLKVYAIPFAEIQDLHSILKTRKIKILYITKGLEDFIGNIVKLTRKLKILSVTGYEVEKSVRRGITIGLGIKNRRPKIYVNLKSAIKEGCDFSSQFLALAEIVK